MRAAARLLAVTISVPVVVSVAGAAERTFADDPAPVAVPGAAASRAFGDLAIPAETLQKLSPEQILSVLREREITRRPNVLLAFAFFGTLAGIVLLSQACITRRERIRNETLRIAIDKGAGIPHDLFVKRPSPASDLRRGLVLIGAGLGLSVVFAVVHLDGQSSAGLWTVGLIPVLMGTAYLAVWRNETKDDLGR